MKKRARVPGFGVRSGLEPETEALCLLAAAMPAGCMH